MIWWLTSSKKFDYPLSNPSVNSAYKDGSGQGYLSSGQRVVETYLPLAMYAFHRSGFYGVHFPEDNIQSGVGGIGNFITFPFQTAGVEDFRRAWVTWHSLVQRMSPDELRKLVLFIDVLKGRELNSASKDPHFKITETSMGRLIVDAVAPLNLRAINVPVEWTVDGTTNAPMRQGYRADAMNPGLTVGKFFSAVLGGENGEINNTPKLQAFVKALFAGRDDECLQLVKDSVSDADLRKIKNNAVANAKSAPETRSIAQALRGPGEVTALYKHLTELLVPSQSPSGARKAAETASPAANKRRELKW